MKITTQIKAFSILLFFFTCLALSTRAQVGGNNTYEFLNLVPSARVSALGSNLIAVKDNDLNLAFYNPSLLNPSMHKTLALNFSSYLAGIKFGSVAYGHKLKKSGVMDFGIHYINYGKFVGTDATGTETGSFKAAEYAFFTGYARQLDSSFSIGANLKAIYSQLDTFNSFGLAADVGATYYNRPKNFTAAFLIKNLGSQLTKYTDVKEKLPFEIQAAASIRLKHVPLRLSLAAENLQKWNLRYVDSTLINQNNQSLVGSDGNTQEAESKSYFFDKLMLHTVIGAEFLITKNFNLRAGFNYRRRKELREEARSGLAGFSFGAGIKISKFHISYGIASYHLGALSNTFSISTNFSDFISKASPTTP
jgi:hypothetical protein